MKYGIMLAIFLIPGNAYCQPGIQSAALTVLTSLTETDNGFDGKTRAHTSPYINQNITGIMVPEPKTVLQDYTSEKGATNPLTLLILKEFGSQPSNEEKVKIRQALNVLNGTKIGKELCKSIGKSGCAWEDFESAGIEITTRDLKYHLPEPLESMLAFFLGSDDPTAAVPAPSYINGRTILCLDKGLINQPPSYIATYIHHELSHIADNRTLGESTFGTVSKYATEYKAVAVQMMLYDELLRTGKLNADPTDGVQFILSIYRWRNGGPKPDTKYSVVIDGKRYSATEIIGLYVNPGDNGLKTIWRLIRFFYGFSEGTLDEKGLKYLLGVRGSIKDLEPKYQAWFPSKPPAIVNPPIIVPPPSNGGNNNSDNGTNGGNNNNGGGAIIPDNDDDDTTSGDDHDHNTEIPWDHAKLPR